MKKYLICLLIFASVLVFAGCRLNQAGEDLTIPLVTEPAEETTVPVEFQPVTTNPFEFDSEIDISDFETIGDTQSEDIVTEPQETKKPAKPNPTEPKPTDPEPTETESDIEPEETQTPTTAAPSYGADGYNNQIVRP